jgi:hypothetical protein
VARVRDHSEARGYANARARADGRTRSLMENRPFKHAERPWPRTTKCAAASNAAAAAAAVSGVFHLCREMPVVAKSPRAIAKINVEKEPCRHNCAVARVHVHVRASLQVLVDGACTPALFCACVRVCVFTYARVHVSACLRTSVRAYEFACVCAMYVRVSVCVSVRAC